MIEDENIGRKDGAEVEENLELYPVFTKLTIQYGSSVGISKSEKIKMNCGSALKLAFKYDSRLLIE